MQTQRKLNLRFGPKDDRDFKYRHIMKLEKPQPLPEAVDLRKNMPGVYDQGNEGSCTMNAGCAHVEMFGVIAKKHVPLSRNFGYWCERVMDGTTKEDAGANMRDICEVFTNTGVCSEATWPYQESNMYTEPPKAAFTEAAQHKVAAYFALNGEQEFKRCLANGYPFLFGMNCYDSFLAEGAGTIAETGIMTFPKWGERNQGGHALLCVGYFTYQGKKYYLIRNSWGTTWSPKFKGHFLMPEEVMHNQNLVSDCYTLRMSKDIPHITLPDREELAA